MIKRILTDILPQLCEGTFTAGPGRLPRAILGLMLLTALIWPASAPAQPETPPPVQSSEGDPDELILTDWFILDEGSSPDPSPMPSLPPNVTPAASAPPAAPTPPADSGPPAGPPLVNLPSVSSPVASPSAQAPVPAEAAPPPAPAETVPPAPVQVQAPAVNVPPAPVQVQTPAESVPPVQVPAGYTPLPTVPLQEAPEPLPDPFALPPVSEPETTSSSPGAPADSRTVPLGQSRSVPAPQWENTAPETTPSQSQIISGVPLPQFDASQSHWIQLEIGQGDGSGQAPSAAPRPTSIYSLPDPAAKPLEPAPAPSPVKADAATDQALDQAISQPPAAGGRNYNSPDGREHLRNLFPEFTSPENLGANTPAAGSSASGAQAPAGTVPKAEPPPKAEPADAGQGQPPPPNNEDVGSSAILKAGGLLTVDEHFGAAEILPPLSGRPRWPVAETPAPTPAPKAAPVKPDPAPPTPAVKAEPPKTASKPAARPAPAKTSGQAKKGGSKKASGGASAAPAGLGLIIINETGRDRVGQQYRSVLTQMGYKVVSVGEGQPGRGAAGQTVINYRPGLKAKAQAVARHLPGRKVLVEAKKGQVLASEIMIYIR